MEKAADISNHQENPSLLFNHNTVIPTAVKEEDSPRKHQTAGGGVGGGDRLKRDEWSEGAVSCLLEAYETKWVLRNRAKLKGHDWEDVARHVSSRSNFTKSPKTQTQCKNKIESMKKRYRSESASAASSWPLYHRLDLLLRGNNMPTPTPPPPPQPLPVAAVFPDPAQLPPPLPSLVHNTAFLSSCGNPTVIVMEASRSAPVPAPAPPPLLLSPPPAPPPFGAAQNSHGSNGIDKIPKEDVVLGITKQSDHSSDKNDQNNNNNDILETDSSTPALYSDKEKLRSKHLKVKKNKKLKRRMTTTTSSDELDSIAGSIRWLAEVVVRSEQTRMEMLRDIERMRAEAEAKRGEMDLKRTEIIANTQLEIAKILAAGTKGVDSSLRIGRN